MVKEENIRDLNHVRIILEHLKSINDYIDENLCEGDYEYEDLCENIVMQICEIEEFILGKEIIDSKALFRCDVRMMSYWEYLRNEITFDELMLSLKEYS